MKTKNQTKNKLAQIMPQTKTYASSFVRALRTTARLQSVKVKPKDLQISKIVPNQKPLSAKTVTIPANKAAIIDYSKKHTQEEIKERTITMRRKRHVDYNRE